MEGAAPGIQTGHRVLFNSTRTGAGLHDHRGRKPTARTRA
jgi:hypothetical protein